MNCHEAYLWMLEAEEPVAAPPVPVLDHLRGCSKCRRRQQRVHSLLNTVQTLPPPPENPQIRSNLMVLVRQTPVGPATSTAPIVPYRPRFRGWWLIPAGVGAAAAAAVLCLLAGGLLYYFVFQQPTNVNNPGPVADPTERVWSDDDLRTRLLGRTLTLAEAKSPADQLTTLLGIANDLESESLAQAGHVDNADLVRLAALYERVLEDGLVPHARALSPEERQKQVPAIAENLRQAENETQLAAVQTPAASDPLLRFSRAAGKAKELLENSKLLPPAPIVKVKAKPGQAPLIETIVASGLVLAGETDPLKRADVCTDVADNLLRTIMEASQRGSDKEEMEKLGTYLGTVIHRAVDGNLDRVDLKAADAKRRAECEQIRQRAMMMMTSLQGHCQTAPPFMRPGLEHAFQASRFGMNNNGMHFVRDPRDFKKGGFPSFDKGHKGGKH